MAATDTDETSNLITKPSPDEPMGEVITTMGDPSQQKRNIIAIEGLRTILCTQIIIVHTGGGLTGPTATNFFAERYAWMLNNMQASCHCFLILSGFVTHLAARSRPAPSTIYGQGLYFVKKWVRLAPIYYLTYVLTALINYGISSAQTMPAVLAFFGVQSMVPFDIDGVYVPMAFMIHMWFVSTLMFSLFMYPFMLRMIRYFDISGNPGRTLCTLLGFLTFEFLVGVVGMWPGWAIPGKNSDGYHRDYNGALVWGESYSGYSHFSPVVMLTFLSGVLIAELAQSMSEAWRDSRIWRYADLTCLLFFLYVTPLLESNQTAVMSCMCLAYRPAQLLWCLSLACTSDGFFTPFFSHPSISSLGKYSYAAYALQFVALHYMPYYYSGPKTAVAHGTALITHVFLTWVFATVASECVEAPVAKVANQWIKRYLDPEDPPGKSKLSHDPKIGIPTEHPLLPSPRV